MCDKDSWRECVGFRGTLTLSIFPTSFSLHPSLLGDRSLQKDLGINWDVSAENYNLKNKLKLMVKNTFDRCWEILLIKINESYKRFVLLSITFNATEDSENNDQIKPGEYEDTSWNIFFHGTYRLLNKMTMKRVIFKLDHHEYQVWTNFNSVIYSTYKHMVESRDSTNNEWNSIISYFKKYPSNFNIYLKDKAIDKSMTFQKLGISDSTVIDIYHRCHCINDCGINVEIAWSGNYEVLLKRLSEEVEASFDDIEITDSRFKDIRKCESLEVTLFQSDYSHIPSVHFSFCRKEVRCSSMMNDCETIVLKVPDVCSGSILRRRLSKRLEVNPRSMILYQREKLVLAEAEIDLREEVKYYIAFILENDGSMALIASSGYADVYMYTNKDSTEMVALKNFQFRYNRCTDFVREVLVLSKLPSHRNVVQYLGIYYADPFIYMKMEYFPMGSLKDHIKAHGPMKEEIIRKVSFDILQGLKHLHDNKINHRDIKASNVLLKENMDARLCDFGLSKILEDCDLRELSQGVSQTAEAGTRRWMAPEVIDGKRYALKCDIWSFGATVVEMITGNDPPEPLNETTIFQESIFRSKSEELKTFVSNCLFTETRSRPNVDMLLQDPFLFFGNF